MKIYRDQSLSLPEGLDPEAEVDRKVLDALGLADSDCLLLTKFMPEATAQSDGGAALSSRDTAASEPFGLIFADPFDEEEDVPALLIVDVPADAAWSITSAYAGLAKAEAVMKPVLALTDARLWYSSIDFADGGEDLLAEFCTAQRLNWPFQFAALRPGVNFIGEATLFPGLSAPPLDIIRDKLGLTGKSLRVAGSVGRGRRGYAFEISVPIDSKPWTLLDGKLNIHIDLFRFGAPDVPVSSEGKVEGLVFGLYGRLSLDQTSPTEPGKSVSVALFFAQNDTRVTVQIRETASASKGWIESLFPSFAKDLAPLGETFNKFVPSLQRLDASLSLNGGGGFVEMEFGYAESFSLFNDAVTLKPSLQLRVETGAHASKSAILFGVWTLPADGDQPATHFNTSISLPSGAVSVSLAEGSALALPKSWREKMEPALRGQKALTLIDLELDGNITAKTFSLEIATEGHIGFTIGSTNITLGNIDFSLSYAGESWEVSFAAVIGIDVYSVQVSAEIADDTVSIIARVPRLRIDLLTRDLLGITPPPELAPLVIEDFTLALSFGGASRLSLSAQSKAPFKLGGLAITLTEFSAAYHGKASFSGKAQIAVGPTEIALALAYANEDWTFTADVTTRFDLGLLLKDMAEAMGFERPLTDKTLEVVKAHFALRFGLKGPRIALRVDVKTGDSLFTIMLVAAKFKVPPSTGPTELGSDGAPLVAGKDGWHYYLQVGSFTIDFTALPLIGKPIKEGAEAAAKLKKTAETKVQLDALTVRLASAPDSDVLAGLFDQLSGEHFGMSPTMTGAVMVSADILVLDYKRPITYPDPARPTDSSQAKGETPASSPTTPAIAAPPPAVAGERPGQDPKDKKPLVERATWVQVEKNLGPAKLDRIGFFAEGKELTLLLDAGAKIGPLEARVIGLSVKTPLTGEFKPEFSLMGLEVSCKTATFSISGALLVGKTATGAAEYTGKILITFGKTTITALGSYTEVDGQASLFVFATLLTPLGGPPFFFVNGLAAGIGFNRDLCPVAIDGVARHAFIKAAMGKEVAIEEAKTVSFVRVGQKWAALGVRFTSFQFLEGVALLIVSFGTETRIQVLARLDFAFPPPPIKEQMLYAELAILAEYLPAKGELKVEGRLSPNSFLLHKDARLEGGFALYAWMAPSPNAGDFVITIGGYNPEFKPPAHYPIVPRLSLNWAVTRELTITGKQYFALTPSIMMAGGQLSVAWKSGSDRAWFDAEAHFLIRFKPFAYETTVSASVGLEVTIAFAFIRETFSVRIGVSLELWGPPFAGRARVNFKVFSLTISFGEGRKEKETIPEWREFATSFLPPRVTPPPPPTNSSVPPVPGLPNDKDYTNSLLTIGASALNRQYRRKATEPEIWVIDPARTEIDVRAVVPATVVTFGAQAPHRNATAFGIKPMEISQSRLKTAFTLRVEHVNVAGTTRRDASDLFTARKLTGQIPAGLWGTPGGQGEALLRNVLVGLSLSVKVKSEKLGDLGADTKPRTAYLHGTKPRWSAAQQPRRETPALRLSIDAAAAGAARAEILAALARHAISPADGLVFSELAATALDPSTGGCRNKIAWEAN